VRIPLDYYRILGLPIQATAEQLQQAHRDRALQLPRREYSEAAIAARKQLLDEAFAVLSNPEQRQDYDASFLAKSYDLEAGRADSTDENIRGTAIAPDSTADPYTPSIEIQDGQLVGALLILLELGEYELVLKLGRPYLTSGSVPLKNGRFGEPDIVLADIVLTVAFACLELGREQWQQGQYENAAESLETGQELLLREGIFASVRGEMQSDLFKLRPYRILELLALPEHHETERRQGLKLLRDMLQDRGGIDGTGDDQSGLNIDDFLRFIQQLRGYLTAAEQQTLFEAEARRPSAVATYLAVYALLARGFAQRQPALIRRAKLMLIRLGTRQDVHLEQAVCALLLGQTEEASRALELSQEYESLAFIREHSQGSPDLLPGLCLYGERWLQNEVFPHFRDLARQQASLKDYFADEQVQAYLEELPNEPEAANQWTSVKTVAVPSYRQTPVGQGGSISDIRTRTARQTIGQSGFSASPPAATATIDSQAAYADSSANGATMPMAERVSQPSPNARNGAASADGGRGGRPLAGVSARSPSPSAHTAERNRGLTSNGLSSTDADSTAARRGSHNRRPKLDRLLFIAAIGLLSFVVLGFLMSRVYGLLFNRGPSLQGEQLQIGVSQPPVPIPEVTAETQTPNDPDAPMSEEVAQQVIETWLSTKSLARGSDHDIDQLNQVLTGEALSQQQYFAEELRQTNSYWEYEHQVISVQLDGADQNGFENGVEREAEGDSSASDASTGSANSTDPVSPSTSTRADQAQIVAEVSEVGELYQNGRLNLSQSYDSTVRVRYDVVRQPEGWRIESIEQL
jgi:hypothetical protein